MNKITTRCCGAECTKEYENDPDQPCWGKVYAVDEWIIEDEGYTDSIWIHACEGHADMVAWGGEYTKEPSNV